MALRWEKSSEFNVVHLQKLCVDTAEDNVTLRIKCGPIEKVCTLRNSAEMFVYQLGQLFCYLYKEIDKIE